jgi:dTDP-4-dehydrorhamnose 3,5-epimerase
MKVINTEIPALLIFEPQIFEDDRGFFFESFQKLRYREFISDAEFVQDNHSRSKKGTLRGLHYQIQRAQGKLIRVVRGKVFDVAVDLRRSSPTFGKWVGTYLSDKNNKQVWVPGGFAHGFYVISDWADVLYKTTEYYAPEHERTLLWNDPDVNVFWPLEENEPPLISEKDKDGDLLQDADLFY